MSLENIYKKIANLKNKKLKRDILKYSQQDSYFTPQTNLSESTREKRLRREISLNQDSNLGYQKRETISADEVLGRRGSLSTRYAPDQPGVQTMRYSDGVYQNPYTGKMYDYNEGFELDGAYYGGGSPSLQSSIMTTANEFRKKNLYKEARLLNVVLNQLKKNAEINLDKKIDLDPLFNSEEFEGEEQAKMLFPDPLTSVLISIGSFIGKKILDVFAKALVEKGKDFALRLVEKEIFKYLIENKEVDLENHFAEKFLGKIKDLQIDKLECEKLQENGKLESFAKFILEKIEESDEPFSTNVKEALKDFYKKNEEKDDSENLKKENSFTRIRIMKNILNNNF